MRKPRSSARVGRTALTVAMILAGLTVPIGTAPVSARSEVRLLPILSGFDQPLSIANDGSSGTVYIVEKAGIIHQASEGDEGWRTQDVFLDITDQVMSEGERGLLGLAFHPAHDENGLFYIFYTRVDEANDEKDVSDMVVAEFRRDDPGSADPASERAVMVIENGTDRHVGGHIAFGPDGFLYVALGDRLVGGDPEENGQDLTTLFGSLLHIDPEDPDGTGPRTYGIPPGNPYVSGEGRDEIWAHGLRSPWRYSFDRVTGDLWLADVGERSSEEVNRSRVKADGQAAGRRANFGWDDCEADLEFEADEGDADDICSSHKLPLYAYGHDGKGGWCSVTGGHVYRGDQTPDWRGLYVAGDFCGGLFVLNQRGQRRWATNSGISLVSFGETVEGELLAVGFGEGMIYRIQLEGGRP